MIAATPTGDRCTESPRTVTGDARIVASLDLQYQAAIKHNDADTVDSILHQGFVMVLGDGVIVSRDDLLSEVRSLAVEYEIQDEDPGTQTVRTWGDTAVVTARLWIKGRKAGKPFERRLWFSDTYVRTPQGWRYAFAQVSLPLSDWPHISAGG